MTNAFRVLPVLDLRRGVAVHARGGRRDDYTEVRGRHGDGRTPVELAVALAGVAGSNAAYVADLDAIEGAGNHHELIQELLDRGLELMVDSGVYDPQASKGLAGRSSRVLATECMAGGGALGSILADAGPAAFVFGLDLRDGDPILRERSSWRDPTPMGLVSEAADFGLERFIVLDLGRVGAGRGPGTFGLVSEIKRRHSGASVFVGGGVAGVEDLRRLRDSGADGALVATALHDGTIRREDLVAF